MQVGIDESNAMLK